MYKRFYSTKFNMNIFQLNNYHQYQLGTLKNYSKILMVPVSQWPSSVLSNVSCY